MAVVAGRSQNMRARQAWQPEGAGRLGPHQVEGTRLPAVQRWLRRGTGQHRWLDACYVSDDADKGDG